MEAEELWTRQGGVPSARNAPEKTASSSSFGWFVKHSPESPPNLSASCEGEEQRGG